MRELHATETSRSRARQVTEIVRSTLEAQIDRGELSPGKRLPTERELAQHFGASRAVIRAAMKALVDAGKISREVGRGSFVIDKAKATSPEPLIFPDIAPAEMMEFRSVLEPAMIDLIMLNASNGDIDAIVACAAEGDSARDRIQWNQLDDKFHRLLAAATHNRLIISLYEAFSAARREPAWARLKQQTMNQNLWREFQAQHRVIATALQRGDREAALQALRDHIMRARANMLGYAMQAVAAQAVTAD